MSGNTTIEISVIIAVVSLAFAVYSGIASMKRNSKADVKADTSELTTVIVKLESIASGVSEIKTEMRDLRSDVRDLRERLAKAESAAAQAHKRIDELVSLNGRRDE